MAIVFRDHTLSDLIGFAYQSWDSRDAAHDLLRRIRAIGTVGGAPLVTIALDGENAWEYYPHDGRDFLRYLYEGLAADPAIRCVTVSEHPRAASRHRDARLAPHRLLDRRRPAHLERRPRAQRSLGPPP